MDRAPHSDDSPEIAFELPQGAFEIEYEAPDALDDGEVPEDPGTAAAREAQQSLLLSQELRRPIDNAVKMAGMSAWTLGVFALISLPGVFSSFTGFFVVVGLGACSFFEFRGRNALRAMKPEGASLLARNQLVLGAVIVVYAGANFVATLGGAGHYDQAIEAAPELEQILGSGGGLGGLMKSLTLMYYALVGVGGVAGQLFMWRYHARRLPLVETFVADTPAWIQEPVDASGSAKGVGQAA